METQKFKPNYIAPIDIKNFSGSFKVSKDVFDILTFSEKIIIWRQDDSRMILFTSEGWNRFVVAMTQKAGFSERQLKNTKKGSDFIRGLNSRAQPLQAIDKNKFKIPKLAYMKKILEGKSFSISFCI